MKRLPILLFVFVTALSIGAQSALTAPGAAEELVIGLSDSPIELNPYKAIYSHEMQMFTALYEGLFTYDSQTLEPVRALAESFQKSKDGKTWTFTIRANAKWADGSPITAQDFVESWLYLLAPETKGEYAVFLEIIKGAKQYRAKSGVSPSTVGIRAEDEHTLTVELVAPAAYFTRLLCHGAFVPVHPSLRGKRVWKPEDVIGNGPYRLVSVSDEEMIFTKSDTYWDRSSVSIPRIRAIFIKTDDEGSQRYNDGEVHWITDTVNIDSLLVPEDIQYAPMFGTGYFFWNSGRSPWKDSRVRRALALLVPWSEIRNAEDYYTPTATLILPFEGYESPTGIIQPNAAEAMALLKAAGFADPKRLPPIRVVVQAGGSVEKALGIMEEAWAEYGIRVEKVPVDSYGNMREVRQDGFDLSFTGWIGDFADPAAFLLMWQSDSNLNDGAYKSKEYDALVRSSMEAEGSARMRILEKAEAMLLDQAVVMPVYHSLSFNVIDIASISGWYSNPMDIHPFKTMAFIGATALPTVALVPNTRAGYLGD